MFKEYTSKPIKRLAFEVPENAVIEALEAESTSAITVGDETVVFKHYEPVNTGDFIVRLTMEDTYHCSRAVFEERNII